MRVKEMIYLNLEKDVCKIKPWKNEVKPSADSLIPKAIGKKSHTSNKWELLQCLM
uniref:Phosphoglucan phosphatase DSP4 amyloplastic n=1 Tax=Rhizophora mucronata TaxID=61149 RepID=A0A2P2KIK5_RHIMU